MTISDLQNEHAAELVGERIYDRVTRLVEALLKKRDPKIYARGAHDYKDALPDVTQDFVLDVLIGERQIDYVMSVATDLAAFDRLLTRQIRRYLARTRVRTVVDNLLERSLVILGAAPFITETVGGDSHYSLEGAPLVDGPITQSALRSAVAVAQGIPKSVSTGEERAPRVFDQAGLTAVLSILCRHVGCRISRQDLHEFLEQLLTPWIPSFLEEGDQDRPVAAALSPEEETLVEEVTDQLVLEMSQEDKVVFQYKFANVSDQQLASALNLSRQSTAPRKKALFARLSETLDDLPGHVQLAVLANSNLKIALEGIDTDAS